MTDNTEKNIITDVLICILIITLSAVFLTKSYLGFDKIDFVQGLLLLFGNIFLSIGISSTFRLKITIQIFFWGSLCFYLIFCFWAMKDDILIVVVYFLIAIIYGIYYLIRKSKFKSSSKSEVK